MKGKRAAGFAAHLDLPPGDRAMAQNANASVVERMPFSPQIGCLKDAKFFLGEEGWIGLQNERIKRPCRSFGNQRAV